jgi:CRISPR-associated endonuclease/helicase Cas3
VWAHSINSNGVRHRLDDHLRGCARLARVFAEPFGLGEIAWWAGLAHDGGKAWCDWQSKLLLVEPTNGRVGIDHKSYGVQLAAQHRLKPVKWIVAGHHGGLTCDAQVHQLLGETAEQEKRLRLGPWADAERSLRSLVPELFDQVPDLPTDFTPGADALTAEFVVRFLFSPGPNRG